MLQELLVAAVIVFACLLLHVAGMMVLAEWLFKRREYLETGSKRRFSFCLVVLFSGIMLLHVSETALWASFFYSRQLFANFETSLYFSLGSYTTIGYGDVVLPTRWRLAGAIEGISGVLLCGVSTGFIFAAINRMFMIRFNIKQQSRLAVDNTE